jgi:small-conductance mechanosensitive channel
MLLWVQLKRFLYYPLVALAGGSITLAALLVALGIVAGARLVASILARATQRLLEQRGVVEGTQFAAAKIVRYVVTLLGVLVAITSIGVRLDALFAASAVLLVGIGFGLQNIAQNFISGLILLVERPIGRGDFVRIGNAYGSVLDIGLRATTVVTRDEVTIIVPNSELVSQQVVNHSVPSNNLRIAVRVAAAYGTDTDLVRRVLLEVGAADPLVLRSPPPEVRLDAFGDSALEFALLVWIPDPREDLRASSRLRFAIDAGFRRAGIEIPFPQRVVHQAAQARPAGSPTLTAVALAGDDRRA